MVPSVNSNVSLAPIVRKPKTQIDLKEQCFFLESPVFSSSWPRETSRERAKDGKNKRRECCLDFWNNTTWTTFQNTIPFSQIIFFLLIYTCNESFCCKIWLRIWHFMLFWLYKAFSLRILLTKILTLFQMIVDDFCTMRKANKPIDSAISTY